MLKLLFEILTYPLSLPVSPVMDYILLSIIGAISFGVAWRVSPGGTFGSLIHWVVRLVTFFTIWTVLCGVIYAANFVISHWMLMLGIIGAVLLIFAVIAFYRKNKVKGGA